MVRLRVRELAQARQITLAQLQRDSQLSISTLRRYWYNTVRFVGLDALEQIAHALGVNVTDLLSTDSPSSTRSRSTSNGTASHHR